MNQFFGPEDEEDDFDSGDSSWYGDDSDNSWDEDEFENDSSDSDEDSWS